MLIPVMIGNRLNGWSEVPNLPPNWSGRSNNITIRRDNRCILASKLPNIFFTNHRSFFPKFHNFIELMKTLGLTLGLYSVVGQDVSLQPADQPGPEDPVERQNYTLHPAHLSEPDLPAERQDATLHPANQAVPEHPVEGQYATLQPANQLEPEHPVDGQDGTLHPANQRSQHPNRGKNEIRIPASHKQSQLHKKSFIDDLTLLEKIELSKLKEKERIIGPLDYHDRFNLTMAPEDSMSSKSRR